MMKARFLILSSCFLLGVGSVTTARGQTVDLNPGGGLSGIHIHRTTTHQASTHQASSHQASGHQASSQRTGSHKPKPRQPRGVPSDPAYIGPGGTAAAPITGTWNTAGNWSPSGVPANGAPLSFGGSGSISYTSTNDITSYTLGSVSLNSTSSATETIAGNSFTVSGSSISQDNTGAFTISNPFAGSSTLTLTGNGTGLVTLSGVISGSNAVTKTGTSTFVLSGTNTFTGQLSIQAGTISVATVNNSSTNGPLGNSATGVTLGGSGTTGTLEYTGATATSSKQFILAAGGTGAFQIDTAATTLTLTGVISGSGALTKSGAGSLSLNAANTFSGDTTVSAGTLRLGNSSALQNSTLNYNNQGGTLSFGTLTTATFGGLSGAQNLALTNTSSGNVNLSVGNNNVDTTYSGNLTGGGSLTKIGTGTLTLSGTNTYSGTTEIDAGVLRINSANGLSSNSNLNFNDSGSNTAVLGLGAGDFTRGLGTGANQVQWNSSGGFAAYGADRIVNIGGAGATLNTSTSGMFGNSSSIFLILGAANADHTVNFQNGINFDQGSNARTIQVNQGTAANGIDAIISGVISGTSTAWNKTGTGTLSLTNSNTYTQGTNVNAGTLLVNNTTGSGTGTGAVVVNGSGTTLGGTGTIGGNVTVGNTSAGAIINPGPKGTNATAGSVGKLTISGALTMSSSNANILHIDASGTLTSNWDQLVANGVTLSSTMSTLQVTIASGLTFAPGSVYELINNTAGSAISGTFNGIAQGSTVTLSGYNFIASYTGGTGNDFILTAVPEPSTWIAGSLAFAALALSQRRKLRQLIVKVTPVIS